MLVLVGVLVKTKKIFTINVLWSWPPTYSSWLRALYKKCDQNSCKQSIVIELVLCSHIINHYFIKYLRPSPSRVCDLLTLKTPELTVPISNNAASRKTSEPHYYWCLPSRDRGLAARRMPYDFPEHLSKVLRKSGTLNIFVELKDFCWINSNLKMCLTSVVILLFKEVTSPIIS